MPRRRSNPARRPRARDNARLAAEILRLRDHLAPRLPDVDPHDLILILHSLLRPPGSGRRIFLRRSRLGAYVF